jgi:hypothetical protein
VVLVVLPAVTIEDLASQNLPNIHKLAKIGAIGLMNTRTAGRLLPANDKTFTDQRYTPESGYAVLGAGTRVIAGTSASLAYNKDEVVEGAKAEILFARRTLIKPLHSEVVHPEIARLKYDNECLNYKVTLGLIGKELHSVGMKTAVIGNSDDIAPHREAVTICMDDLGLVDFGNISSSVNIPGQSALRVETNPLLVLEEAARCIGLANFVVIELGDTARLDRIRLELMDRAFFKEKARLLRKSDALLGGILDLVDLKTSYLIVVSPYPPSYALELTNNSLCPILIAGPGIQPGLLASGATRCPGVVANTDIAPSVLHFLGVDERRGVIGRSVTSVPKTSTILHLININSRISHQTVNIPILRQNVVLLMVLVVLVTLAIIFDVVQPSLRIPLIFIVLFPVSVIPAFALTGLFSFSSPTLTWFFVFMATSLIIILALKIGKGLCNALMLISLFFTAIMWVDLLGATTICRFAVMGYSLAEGSRYYGIGNEFMGALVGSTLLGIVLLSHLLNISDRRLYIFLGCGLIATAVIVGAPVLGANVGGTITAVAGFGFALLILNEAKEKRAFDYRRVLPVIFAVAVILALYALFDSIRSDQGKSHFGQAVAMLTNGDGYGLILLIKRKLAMNLSLIRVSLWSRLFAFYIASTVILVKKSKWDSMTSLSILPSIYGRVVLTGLTIATVTALIFNDSGIVAAATCFTYAWTFIAVSNLTNVVNRKLGYK